MRLNRMFIGKYEPIRRPTNTVDGSLMRRIQEAKRDLAARGKDVVPMKERPLKGHIGFQELSRGGDHVQIRNARIKEL